MSRRTRVKRSLSAPPFQELLFSGDLNQETLAGSRGDYEQYHSRQRHGTIVFSGDLYRELVAGPHYERHLHRNAAKLAVPLIETDTTVSTYMFGDHGEDTQPNLFDRQPLETSSEIEKIKKSTNLYGEFGVDNQLNTYKRPPLETSSSDIGTIKFTGGLYRTFGASQQPFYERNNLYRSAPTDSSSVSEYTDRTPREKKRRRRRRRISVWLAATIMIGIALIAAAVLAALLGRNLPMNSDEANMFSTTTPIPQAEIAQYQGSIGLTKLNYTVEYANKSSDLFKQLEDQLCNQGISQSFTLLSDADALKTCTVVSFTQSSTGTVEAVFELALDRSLLQPIVTQGLDTTASNTNLDVANLVESVMQTATQQSQDSTKPLVPFLQETTTNTSTTTVVPDAVILCPDFPNLPTQVQAAGTPNSATLWNCSHPAGETINTRNGICDFSCPSGLLLQGAIQGQVTRLRCSETGASTGDWVWQVPVYESVIYCATIPTTTLPPEGSGAVA